MLATFPNQEAGGGVVYDAITRLTLPIYRGGQGSQKYLRLSPPCLWQPLHINWFNKLIIPCSIVKAWLCTLYLPLKSTTIIWYRNECQNDSFILLIVYAKPPLLLIKHRDVCWLLQILLWTLAKQSPLMQMLAFIVSRSSATLELSMWMTLWRWAPEPAKLACTSTWTYAWHFFYVEETFVFGWLSKFLSCCQLAMQVLLVFLEN